MTFRSHLALLSIATALIVVGCPESHEGDCVTRDDCAPGVACIDGRCAPSPPRDGGFDATTPVRDGETPTPDAGLPDAELPDAELPDAELPDAGPPDAGDPCMGLCGEGEECCAGSCVPLGCDDGNPCTDDACGAAGCEHTPNEAACDDGIFCNGTDTCAGGTCSVHAGDPCAGDTICDEAMSTCVGCIVDGDCPSVQFGPWGDCSFSTTCAVSGTRTRTRTEYACGAGGVCEPSTTTPSGSCTRASTEGNTCGTTTFGSWSSCSYPSTCARYGTRTRTRTDRQCNASASCANVTTTESETGPCDRGSRTGVSCGPNYETCTSGGLCRCQGAVCGASQSCGLSGCGTTPTFTNDGPSCIDFANTSGPTFGYTITGPPGAYFEKWDHQVSCGTSSPRCSRSGNLDGSGQAGSVLVVDTVYPCDDSILGRWESWAVVDGIRVPSSNATATFYRSGCSGTNTCIQANSYCPSVPIGPAVCE